MKLLSAVAVNNSTNSVQLGERNNAFARSDLAIRIDEEIPGLPTENWMSNRIGTVAFFTNPLENLQAPAVAGTRNELEAHATIFVPFNTDFTTATNNREILGITNLSDFMTFSIFAQTGGAGWSLFAGRNDGSASQEPIENFTTTPGHVYHVVLRVLGQTATTASDGSVEVWVNNELIESRQNVSFTTRQGGLLIGEPQITAGGPNIHYYMRDVLVFSGLSTEPLTPPTYYRAEALTVVGGSVDASNTFDLPVNGAAGLVDGTDGTFAEGLNSDDRFSHTVVSNKGVLSGTTEAQIVYVNSTKATTENNEPHISVSSLDGTVIAETSYIDNTTGTFTERYLALDLEHDITDLKVNVSNTPIVDNGGII